MNIFRRIAELPLEITGRELHALGLYKTAHERRVENRMVNDQIKAYKTQTELAQKQLAEVQEQKAAEKRRINEKQIRTLRNTYRPSGGFLNYSGATGQALGESSEMSNKLGT